MREPDERRAPCSGPSPRCRLPPCVGRRRYRTVAGHKRSESLVALCRGAPDPRGCLHRLTGYGGWRTECAGVSPLFSFLQRWVLLGCRPRQIRVHTPGLAQRPVRQWRRVVRVCPPSLDKASLGLRYSSCLSARSADKILTSPHLRRPPLCPPRIVYGEITWWQGNLREGHGLNAACSASGVVSPRAPSRGATRRSYACPIRCACKDWDR